MTATAQRSAAATSLGVAAWILTAVFYFYQYSMRSAPAVMMPELTAAFGLNAVALASLLGLFYYAYAPFSLVAGVAMDQIGPKWVVPMGAAAVATGALLFSTGDPMAASIGRFLQGAGGVFALIGAVYIATSYMPASMAATLIGATQMFGMAGGSAGQFLVGPMISDGLAWDRFWFLMGLAGFPIAVALFLLIPKSQQRAAILRGSQAPWYAQAARAMATVFRNPQSVLCGIIAGLLFIPTTVFDMVWGVRYLQEGHDMPYSMAVLRSASVPFGWIIGCPVLGLLSDRIGRRKPVIAGAGLVLLACMAFALYGRPGVLPPYSVGLVAGFASGAAMIPYTVIKEVNRPEHSGTATGVINFVNFSLTALIGPIFARVLTGASDGGERALAHYQATFLPMLFGVALAVFLTLFLRETGSRVRPTARHASGGELPAR